MKQRIIPYVSALAIFFLISLLYFVPDVLEGRKLSQHDIVQFKGMSKEVVDHREKFGEEPLWTNSMYGGMPAYLVSTEYKSNLLKKIHNILAPYNLRPVSFIFLYLVGAFIAFLLFGINPWLSMAGAIAYAFSSYFFVIIEAGHVSKVFALGYMPPVIAGVYAAFRGKAMLGSIITGLFLGLQILVNHVQITYYTMLIILILGIFELVNTIKTKEYKEFLKPVGWLILFIGLAVGANFSNLYTTYEYGKYSIRGKSELSVNAENKTTGLDKDYATQWSYGIGETFSLLVPNINGGSTTGELKAGSNTYDLIKSRYSNSEAKKFCASVPLYWGKQPGTSGPVYIGAAIVFLFILGMFLVKGPVKWWLFAVTVFSIMLSWGHNFNALTNLMFDFFPGYNKFRSVSMTLIMAEFAMPLLAILAVKEILTGKIPKQEFMKAMKYAAIGLAGTILVIVAIAGSFDMTSPYDDQYRAQGMGEIVDAMQKDRLSMLRSDAFRSLIIVAMTVALIYFAFLKKIKFSTLVILLSLLVLVDMWSVNKRYLNSKDFVTKKEDKNPFTPSTADMLILKDRDSNFKVLNMSLSPLQDASTSYYHKSLGGYHGAKMRRYQELFDHNIQNEMMSIINTLQKRPVPEAVDSTMATLNAMNMLNTRYIIYSPDAPPLVNKHELGNAWFVKEFIMVPNADAEIAAIATFKPSEQAVVDERFSSLLEGFKPVYDSAAKISLTEYRANYLKYSSTSQTDQLAVFSEIYYDKGWEALIDGKTVPHFRANYLLRALVIPSGSHVIEFRFHPDSYFIGEKISLASSILLILLLAGMGYREWRKNSEKKD